MNRNETIALLALVAAYDRRTVGEADVEAWHTIATECGWTFPLARRALIDYKKRGGDRPWLQPAHITDAIEAARATIRRQVFSRDLVPPKHLADDPRAELEWRRQHIAAITERALTAWASGQQLPQLEAPAASEPGEPPENITELIGSRFRLPAHARNRHGQPAPASGERVAKREAARAELDELRRRRGESVMTLTLSDLTGKDTP